jgi:AraC-like DNA-binding protein
MEAQIPARLPDKLGYFSELLTCGQSLYYCEYNPVLGLVKTSCPNPTFVQGLLSLGNCRDYLLDYISKGKTKTLLLQDLFGISWVAVFEVVSEQLYRVHLIGPAFNSDVSVSKLALQMRGTSISDALGGEFLEQLRNVPVIQLSSWFQYGLMLHFAVTSEKTAISDFEFQAAQSSEQLPSEARLIPKSKVWFAEQTALKMIEEGRLDYQKAFGDLSAFSGYAVYPNAGVRPIKNAANALNALCVRAAIHGGLDVETAYYVGNYYIDKVENAQTIAAISQLNTAMYEDFIQRVHKCKTANGVSKSIQACCNYIDLHITEDIKLQQLALESGYSKYYLTQKFMNEVGCTISDYIKGKKIEKAKVLLSSTKTSIQEIGEQLGYCNHSHFTAAFKSVERMTPGEYREGNKEKKKL